MQVTIKTAASEITGELNKHSSKYLIVICHGFKASGKAEPIPSLAKRLNRKGYATFTFDFPKDSETDVRRQVDDLAAILKHFDSYQGFVMFGHSLGAISASIAAIKLPKVTGVITINGFFGTGKIGKQYRRDFVSFRIASCFIPSYRRVWKFFKNELVPARLTVPALVIHAQADIVVPIAHSRRHFAEITAPKELRVLNEADHGLTLGKHVDETVEAIDAWLKRLPVAV